MTSSEETEFDPARADALRALAGTHLVGDHDGRGLRIAVVAARFNGAITIRLLEGALAALREAGVAASDITVAWVPGAYEIPMMALALADGPSTVDAIVTLGAVIRGETGHYDIVAGECARGVQDVQLTAGVPVIFGVLTTNTVDQALQRSLPDLTNKGREAALSAVEMVSLLRQRRGR